MHEKGKGYASPTGNQVEAIKLQTFQLMGADGGQIQCNLQQALSSFKSKQMSSLSSGQAMVAIQQFLSPANASSAQAIRSSVPVNQAASQVRQFRAGYLSIPRPELQCVQECLLCLQGQKRQKGPTSCLEKVGPDLMCVVVLYSSVWPYSSS
uniref:Uncharacterized protein n=1 Tax=Ditylenchus dipsaci TaxID=166011 RepID=A0A915DM23_9BILA